MIKKENAENAKTEGTVHVKPIEISAVMQKVAETLSVIKQYKAENPGIDVDAILSSQNELYPLLKHMSNREIDKFVAFAKEQGTKMSFDSMEMGILAAGRKDMQSGLSEVLNSLKFDKPECPECGGEMANNGRSKKKL